MGDKEQGTLITIGGAHHDHHSIPVDDLTTLDMESNIVGEKIEGDDNVSNDQEENTIVEVTTPDKPVNTIMLIFMGYVTVFGAGPYAMEPLIKEASPLITFIGLLVVPWFGIQCALMTAELSSAYPQRGGYLIWLREAFGPFWGFQVATFSLMSITLDLALYPVLFRDYLKIAVDLDEWLWAIIILLFILVCAILSILGTSCIGKSSTIFTILAVSPFIVLVVVGLKDLKPSNWIILPSKSLNELDWGLIISTIAWSAQGFDSLSQVSSEVKKPSKLRFAMVSTLGLVILSALLPLLVAVSIDDNYDSYSDGHFVEIAQMLSNSTAGGMFGNTLQYWMIGGACIGNLATFNMYLYTGSTTLSVWAGDYIGVSAFRYQYKNGGPTVAIAVLSVIVYCLTFLDFTSIIKIDQSLYSCSLIMKYASLVHLRRIKPDLPRPYKIGFNTVQLAGFVAPPILICIFTIVSTCISSVDIGVFMIMFTIVSFLSPIAMYFGKRRFFMTDAERELDTSSWKDMFFVQREAEHVQMDDVVSTQPNDAESSSSDDEKRLLNEEDTLKSSDGDSSPRTTTSDEDTSGNSFNPPHNPLHQHHHQTPSQPSTPIRSPIKPVIHSTPIRFDIDDDDDDDNGNESEANV
eukprot:TRINITY_DN7832_c0_g1_i1.p2 TRINITY_DN7832_c0_g1~~TRINITY_DN7832_c0_g1_i1.p2  ORF type:complete len:633 (-),score=132.33 TRINITY_DN7832_c0_g1_i1:198-2096(-)